MKKHLQLLENSFYGINGHVNYLPIVEIGGFEKYKLFNVVIIEETILIPNKKFIVKKVSDNVPIKDDNNIIKTFQTVSDCRKYINNLMIDIRRKKIDKILNRN